MPLPKSITETWTFTAKDGTEFTLGPVTATVAAQAMDLFRKDCRFEAYVHLAAGGGLRGWKAGDETVTRIGPAELARLTLKERQAIGEEIAQRCILTAAESD